ncbi:hypothetical protein [Saccharothrix algeriensis]|uniref:Uncharacterized protein n=1 Tax=Saccharothrix algeriensis TaxID=173560 RepID=A0ABS2SEL1_9PSEU|nr:hypothetical protein [Saccharothrix algeriensis]MBM7814365.1 hypothetical protein [Saccharothrix algeriensis]
MGARGARRREGQRHGGGAGAVDDQDRLCPEAGAVGGRGWSAAGAGRRGGGAGWRGPGHPGGDRAARAGTAAPPAQR